MDGFPEIEFEELLEAWERFLNALLESIELQRMIIQIQPEVNNA